MVIPSRDRPRLVLRAVKSVLTQAYEAVEVIVVVDGPDEVTVRELRQIEDPRLRMVALPTWVGAAEARNVGVERARGKWIAFLDDDDEWLPNKLTVQTRVARSSPYAIPVVTSRFIARMQRGDFVLPERVMDPSEPVSEYLFTRQSLWKREGTIATSMLFTKKALCEKVPFRRNAWIHEDWEWLLQVSTMRGVGIEFVPEALVVRDMKEDRRSLSNSQSWKRSLKWIQLNQNLVTPRAYAGFIAILASPLAAREGDWKALWPLLREIVGVGRPGATELVLFFQMWLIPRKVRRWLRAFVARGRRIRTPSTP